MRKIFVVMDYSKAILAFDTMEDARCVSESMGTGCEVCEIPYVTACSSVTYRKLERSVSDE